jgi:hypothetical protein
MRAMTTLRALRSLALTLALAACSKGFGAGFEGEITMTTQRPGSAATSMVIKAKGDMLRFDVKSTSGEASHAIFDPAANKVVMVMDAQKSYMDLDFAKPSAPQPNTSADSSNVQKTGKHDKVAGVDCEVWTTADAAGKRSEVCIAEGIAYFDLASLKAGTHSGLSKELRDKRLFPLRSVDFDAKGVEVSRSEVTKIEKKSLDAAEFSVPADYKKLELPSTIAPK